MGKTRREITRNLTTLTAGLLAGRSSGNPITRESAIAVAEEARFLLMAVDAKANELLPVKPVKK